MHKMNYLLPLALCALVFISGCALTGEDESVRKTFSTDETLSAVVVRDDNADITIESSSRAETSVDYPDGRDNHWYDFDISITDGTLTIEKIAQTRNVSDSALVIHLPEKVYENIQLETTNGDIILKQVQATTLKCASANGELCFDHVSADTLVGTTENGDITGSLLGAQKDYTIHSSTTTGMSSLDKTRTGGDKNLDLSTTNGDIDIEFVP